MRHLVSNRVTIIIEYVGNSIWLKCISRHNKELGHTLFHLVLMRKSLQSFSGPY